MCGSSPTAALTQGLYHLAQALRAILPIQLGRLLGSIGITALDTADNVQVFADGKTELVDNRTRVETPIPLGLRLDGFMDGSEAGTSTGIHDSLMKTYIQVKSVVGVGALGFGKPSKTFIEFTEFLDQGGSRLGFQLRT